MAKLIDINGLRAVVAKINGDTKALKVLIDGKANATHEHVAADVKFDDGKNLVEKLAEIQAGGNVSLEGYATEAYVQGQIEALIDGAPEALDTLKELAAALGDDANFASTMVTEFAKKVDKVEGQRLITQEEAAKLAGLENYNDAALAGRVAALEGINHDDFAKAADLANKVDKEDGKVLIAQTELDRLAGLHNYDDAALIGRVAALEAIDHSVFLKADAIADMATKQDLADLETRIGQAAVDAVPEHYEKVEVAEGQEAPADAKVVVADDAVDFDPATQVKVSDVNGAAQVGETVVFVPAQEGQAATGIYQTIENKVQEVAGYEVATEEELLAMYDEVKAEQPQA